MLPLHLPILPLQHCSLPLRLLRFPCHYLPLRNPAQKSSNIFLLVAELVHHWVWTTHPRSGLSAFDSWMVLTSGPSSQLPSSVHWPLEAYLEGKLKGGFLSVLGKGFRLMGDF